MRYFRLRAVPRANRILNRMREKVMDALDQKGEDYEKKDSIDIALCVYEPFRGVLQYSGANRPLMLVRDGELKEYRPDKMPIGVAPLEEVSFTNHRIEVQEGDLIYLFSDGYPDQFGWETNKKFKINASGNCLFQFPDGAWQNRKTILRIPFLNGRVNRCRLMMLLCWASKFDNYEVISFSYF